MRPAARPATNSISTRSWLRARTIFDRPLSLRLVEAKPSKNGLAERQRGPERLVNLELHAGLDQAQRIAAVERAYIELGHRKFRPAQRHDPVCRFRFVDAYEDLMSIAIDSPTLCMNTAEPSTISSAAAVSILRAPAPAMIRKIG